MNALHRSQPTEPLFRLDSADEDEMCPKCGAPMEGDRCSKDGCSGERKRKGKTDGNCDEYDMPMKGGNCPKADKCGRDGCAGKPPKAKMDSEVMRVDWGFDPWSQDSDWSNVKALTKTDNGSLIGRACVTNVGVFTYTNADGTVTHELRPEEEVFHPDALASFALLPITNNHPTERVTPDNVSKYQVGSTGDGILTDSMRVFAPLTITKQEGLEAIAGGRRGLSMGYSTVVKDTAQTYPNGKTYPCPGVWMGVRYDRIQTNMRGNHLALVDIPRAGDDAYLKMDGVGIAAVPLSTNQPNHPRSENMRKIKLDAQSADYDVPEQVADRFDALNTELTTKTTEVSTLTAKLDSLTADLAKVKTDSEAALKAEQAKLDGAVKSRLDLINQATRYGVELKGDENDAGIKRAIILGAYPDAAPKLDAADEAYLQGRFDAAVESLEAAHKNDGEQAMAHQRQDAADHRPGAPVVNPPPQNLHQRADSYRESVANAWQNPVGASLPVKP